MVAVFANDEFEEHPDHEEEFPPKDAGKTDGGTARGGGVFFDGLDEFDKFDKAEFQGLPWDDFWKERRYGAYLHRHITPDGEKFLQLFIEDPDLRNKVMDISLSEEHRYPTLLLDTGNLLQIQHQNNELTRVRASSSIDLDGIKIVMGIFKAEGKSIDPKDVKFGRTPGFEARVRPLWEAEFKRMQSKPYADILRQPRPAPTMRRTPAVT